MHPDINEMQPNLIYCVCTITRVTIIFRCCPHHDEGWCHVHEDGSSQSHRCYGPRHGCGSRLRLHGCSFHHALVTWSHICCILGCSSRYLRSCHLFDRPIQSGKMNESLVHMFYLFLPLIVGGRVWSLLFSCTHITILIIPNGLITHCLVYFPFLFLASSSYHRVRPVRQVFVKARTIRLLFSSLKLV